LVNENLSFRHDALGSDGGTHLNLAQKLHEEEILLPIAKGSPGMT
jgi:hypothetical protein